MSTDYTNLIQQLHGLKELHVPCAAATNMPFVSCDQETFNDQVWLFRSLETSKDFIKQYEEKNIPLKGTTVQQENLQEFFMDLHFMGINEVVFCDNGAEHKLELANIVKLPDYSNLPEPKRPLMNPALQLSTIYFFQEIRCKKIELPPEKLDALAEEMYVNLAKARLLMPVQVIESVELV